jgi:hypothetical protein
VPGRALLTLALTGTLLVAGCADTTDGTPTAAAPPSFPRALPQLVSLLEQGTRSVHTAHLTLDFNVAGSAITATGEEQLNNGTATAVGIVERVPGFGTLELRVLGTSSVYVKDPRRASTPKPWVHVTSAATDPLLKQIYSSLQSTAAFGSLDSMGALLRAAAQLQFVGRETINGVPVGHYRFVVQTQQLPANFPNRDQIIGAGVSQIPVEIYIDPQGRTRKAMDTVTVATTKATVGFELTSFNTPVHITAPPPGQTSDS